MVDLADADGFVIADIPGLIEGASEGVGLGHEFLKHIERTRVIIHLVDAAATEGRDPVEDVRTINRELASYNRELLTKPQVIAANKLDVLYGEEVDIALARIRDAFAPEGVKVFGISAVSGAGVKELLYYVGELLKTTKSEPKVFEREYFFDPALEPNLPYTVNYDEGENVYIVEGPRVEKMLGYTNIDSEKGFEFFQRFLKENGILDELEKLGIKDGDTVRMYGLEFDYYQ